MPVVATILLLSGPLGCGAESLAPVAEPPPLVIVLGNTVRSPGAVPYTADMTVTEAIAAAGGLGQFGGSKFYLVRDSKMTILDFREIRRNPEKEIQLKRWDIIYIPG